MAQNFPPRILLGVAVALVAGSCAWFGWQDVRPSHAPRTTKPVLAALSATPYAAVGRDAALRVVEVAPDSRLPERRFALAPDEQ